MWVGNESLRRLPGGIWRFWPWWPHWPAPAWHAHCRSFLTDRDWSPDPPGTRRLRSVTTSKNKLQPSHKFKPYKIKPQALPCFYLCIKYLVSTVGWQMNRLMLISAMFLWKETWVPVFMWILFDPLDPLKTFANKTVRLCWLCIHESGHCMSPVNVLIQLSLVRIQSKATSPHVVCL